jgi:putative phosphoesterase
VLRELRGIAPVHAVIGNTDDPASGLPRRLDLALGGLRICVTHGHELGSPKPENLASSYDADVIVFGHTHRPVIDTVGATLVVNPGAAGPRRFNLQPSVGLLRIEQQRASAEILPLTLA